MKLQEINAPARDTKLNKLFESRFGFKIDYEKLTVGTARALSNKINENMTTLRRTHGVHATEQSVKYMELLLVNEALQEFMRRKLQLNEGEVGQAEVIAAAKSIVDTMQDLIEKIGRLQNEELPPLLDSIRDQLGTDKATVYREQVSQAILTLSEQLAVAREAFDTGARVLSGESLAQDDMNMTGVDSSAAIPPEMDDGTDGFAATAGETGGTTPVGRELR